MDTGRFPVDLVLFGMIAGFLVLRLRSILGRRTGFERPPAQPYQPPGAEQHGPMIEGRAEPASPVSARPVPEAGSPLGRTLARIREFDRGFDPARFLEGAEKAFRLIVEAFASGDRATLRTLVAADVFQAFEQAIAVREQAGQTQQTEIRAIVAATIEAAELRGSVAQVTVKFVSDQVSLTRDKASQPVAGTEAVTEMVDIWTFERDLASHDPTWRLVSVRPA